MRLRTVAVTSLVAVTAAGALTPALAAPKQIKKTYTATAPTPDPTPFVGYICDPLLPGAKHEQKFTVPAAGTLKVEMAQPFDWALALLDDKGKRLAESDSGDPLAQESMQLKFKRKTNVVIRACNFAGTPTSTVTYTFTFLK